MIISRKEEHFFSSVFEKVFGSGSPVDKKTCKQLVARGIDDPESAKQVIDKVFVNSSIKTLERDGFYKLMKLVGAYQSGYKISDIANVEDLPKLPPPKLPKKSSKTEESKKEEGMKSSTQSSMQGSQVSMNFSESGLKSSELENSTKHEEKKIEEETKDSDHLRNMDDDLRIPQNEPVYNLLDSTVPVKKPEQTRGYPELSPASNLLDSVTPFMQNNQKNNEKDPIVKKIEYPALESPQKIEEQANKRRMVEVDDEDDLILKKEDPIEIPNFTESVRIDPKQLVNEMKKKNRFEEKVHVDTEYLDDQIKEDDEEEISSSAKIKKTDLRRGVEVKAFEGIKFKDFLEQNQRIKIQIVNTTTHNSESYFGYGAFITYRIQSQFSPSEVYETDRRFKDFDWLNSYLRNQKNYKGLVFPKMPEKKTVGSTETAFINQRKGELELYLKALASHPILSQDEVLRIFLGDTERGNFETTKDNNPVSGSALDNLDWSKMKENIEYAKASMKTKWGGEEPRFDWKDVKPKIEEVLRIDETNNRLMKTIQQKETLYKTKEQIDSQLDVLSLKIANMMTHDLSPIRMMTKLFVREIEHNNNEKKIVEHFGNQVKFLKGKLDGFKESRDLLLKIFHEILTYQELLRVKHGKTFEYQANNEQSKYEMADQDVKQIHNKLLDLYADAETVRDNLSNEADILQAEFDVFLPDELYQYYEKHADLYKNAFKNKYASEEEE